MEKMNNTFTVTGTPVVKHFNAHGELVNEMKLKNMVVTLGLEDIASLLHAEASVARPQYMAIGLDGTAPAAGQTDLLDLVAADGKNFTSLQTAVGEFGTVSGVSISYEAEFTAIAGGDSGTIEVREAGLFTDVADPTAGSGANKLFARVTFPGSGVPISSLADKITITWTITMGIA